MDRLAALVCALALLVVECPAEKILLINSGDDGDRYFPQNDLVEHVLLRRYDFHLLEYSQRGYRVVIFTHHGENTGPWYPSTAVDGPTDASGGVAVTKDGTRERFTLPSGALTPRSRNRATLAAALGVTERQRFNVDVLKAIFDMSRGWQPPLERIILWVCNGDTKADLLPLYTNQPRLGVTVTFPRIGCVSKRHMNRYAFTSARTVDDVVEALLNRMDGHYHPQARYVSADLAELVDTTGWLPAPGTPPTAPPTPPRAQSPPPNAPPSPPPSDLSALAADVTVSPKPKKRQDD